MGENNVQVDFNDFLDDLDGKKPTEESEHEEVTEEEESLAEEEVQDEEVEQEDEDDSQEEAEEETPASDESEEEKDEYEDLEEEEKDPRDAVIAQMRQELDALKKNVQPAPKEEKEEPPPLPDDLQQRILGDLDIDDVTSDPKLFMQVIQNALVAGRDLTYEHVMKSVPKLVIQQTKGYQDLMAMQRRFYKQNKDLRPFKSTVATAANEVHSQHPDWSIEKVLEEAAKVSRQTIGITQKKGKKVNPNPKKAKQKPAFAKATKTKKVKKQISSLQSDINSIIDLD